MRVLSVALIVGMICVSCHNSQQSIQSNSVDSMAVNPAKAVVAKDTTIEYSIEGVSSEGASAKARYVGGRIKECEIAIYGETGQNKIVYMFNNNKIDVSEKQLVYNTSLENVKSDKDMKVKKEITYVLDLNGTLIGKADVGRTDIFSEFKKVVPLEIK